MLSEFFFLSLKIILISLISFFISIVALYFLIPIFRIYLLDKPEKRSSHNTPKPRGGGITFVLIGCFGSLYLGDSSLIYCLPLAIFSFIDDFKNLSVKKRFFIQLFTTIFIFLISDFGQNLFLQNFNFFTPIIFLLIIISGIAVINFTNFMDGIDGLVAGCLSIFLIYYFFSINQTFFLLPLILSLFAFLIFNWSPSKVFMGDVGSTFLGALCVLLILKLDSLYNILSYLLILFPLFGDAFFCVIFRILNRENIFQPHKKHLYQKLHQYGWTHQKVSIIYISATLINVLMLSVAGLGGIISACIFEIYIGKFLNKKCSKEYKI